MHLPPSKKLIHQLQISPVSHSCGACNSLCGLVTILLQVMISIRHERLHIIEWLRRLGSTSDLPRSCRHKIAFPDLDDREKSQLGGRNILCLRLDQSQACYTSEAWPDKIFSPTVSIVSILPPLPLHQFCQREDYCSHVL